MPVIIQSNMRRMTCRDPGVVKNYTLRFEKLAKQHNLLEKTRLRHLKSNYPHNLSLPIEYEKLDTIRHAESPLSTSGTIIKKEHANPKPHKT